MVSTVLLCTVGSSHQPIVKAIEAVTPDYVCFFCTDRDVETGKAGSIGQVTDNVIKAHPQDEKPTLPNIPTQAGLGSDRFEPRIVSADDLDATFFAIRTAVREVAAQFPDARFIADYTGGTKTMTAALVCAALERPDVELQLVSGARPNLVRVRDGTEQAMEASVARIRLDQAMTPYLRAWQRFDYHHAAVGLGAIRVPVSSPDRGRLRLACELSRALARWDNFDHKGALELLGTYASQLPRDWQVEMLPTLGLLATEKSPPKAAREPARLFDLLLNAERRASQSRFDDAVARVYRLIEWTAQWQLRLVGIDTSDVRAEHLPPDMKVPANRDGKFNLGLWNAWRVVAHKVDGPARSLVAGESHGELQDLLAIRNQSILAHGFEPVGEPEWDRMKQWVEARFRPVLEELAKESRLTKVPRQLPRSPPASILATA